MLLVGVASTDEVMPFPVSPSNQKKGSTSRQYVAHFPSGLVFGRTLEDRHSGGQSWTLCRRRKILPDSFLRFIPHRMQLTGDVHDAGNAALAFTIFALLVSCPIR
jgi:hypothetical protein